MAQKSAVSSEGAKEKGVLLAEKRLACGIYFYRAGHLRPSDILHLAVFPEYLV